MLGEFLEAYGFVGIFQGISVVYGFLRTKILAIWLGPGGVGIFSQADLLLKSLRRLMSFGGAAGITKQVAEYHGDSQYRRIARMLTTVVYVYLLIGSLMIVAGLLFSRTFSVWVFGDERYRGFINITFFSAVLMLEYVVLLSAFRGLLRWRDLALSALAGYSASLVLTAVLILRLRIYGAVLSLLLSQAAHLLVVAFFFRRGPAREHGLRLLAAGADWPELLSFWRLFRPLFVIYLISALAPLWVRGEIIRQLGADANGIYQTVWGISLVYMGFISNITSTYGMPRVAMTRQNSDLVSRIQNNSLRINLLLLAPAVAGLFLLRDAWIPILYRRDFLPAADIILWHFLGDILRVARESWSISLIPLERFPYLTAETFLLWGGWVLASGLMMPHVGLLSVPLGYFLANLVVMVPNLLYMTSRTGFSLWKRNRTFLGKAALLLAVGLMAGVVFKALLWRGVALVLVLLGMAFWLPDKGEYAQVIGWIQSRISKGPTGTKPDDVETDRGDR